MPEIEFFRDAMVELGRITQSLWTLNLTVLLAAVGWGVTSRNWSRGLSPPICIVASAALSAFLLFNLYSLNTFYLRANAASEQLLQAWTREGKAGEIDAIFGAVGRTISTSSLEFMYFLVVVLIGELAIAIGVGVLLSNIGRRPSA